MPARIDVPPGTVFGRLTVVEEAPRAGARRMMLCRCECGATKIIDVSHLRSGHTTSCGCLRREVSAELFRTNPLIAEYRTSDLRREQTRRRAETHGLSHHPDSIRWRNMVDRCTNPENLNYHNYGGRGIKVCPEWRDVAVFCAWIEENLGPCPAGMSMDRIDNDGNYEPGNIRWATQRQQLGNFRGTPVRGEGCWNAKITAGDVAEIRRRYASGEGQPSIAEEYGMNPGTIGAIVAGKTWRHVGGPVTAPHGFRGETHANAKLTWASVASIRARAGAGETQAALAREFGVSGAAISSVLRGKTWRPRDSRLP